MFGDLFVYVFPSGVFRRKMGHGTRAFSSGTLSATAVCDVNTSASPQLRLRNLFPSRRSGAGRNGTVSSAGSAMSSQAALPVSTRIRPIKRNQKGSKVMDNNTEGWLLRMDDWFGKR